MSKRAKAAKPKKTQEPKTVEPKPVPDADDEPRQAVSGTVIIDPGHGGMDPGSIGLNGVREADLTLQISKHMMAELETRGVSCTLTRSEDVHVEMSHRVADAAKANCLVSVHCNAHENPEANGVETIYPAPGGSSKALANYVQQAMVKHLYGRNRGIKASPSAEIPRKLYVLATADCPAVIAECGFITNAGDASHLGDGGKAAGKALAEGVIAFLSSRAGQRAQ